MSVSSLPVSEPLPPALSAASLVEVGLDQLQDSPFKFQATRNAHRNKRPQFEALMKSIEADGVLQPPTVRTLPGATASGRYEILAGHQRVAALRALRDAAMTDEERQRYSKVLVRVASEVDDRVAYRWSISDNVHRIDLDPVEMSEAIMGYLETTGLGPEEASAELGIPSWKVHALLRLSVAPVLIQQAVAEGFAGLGEMPSLPDAWEEREEQASRRLDLFVAMELQHVYCALPVSEPDSTLKSLIQKALLENWSVRDARKEGRRLIATYSPEEGKRGGKSRKAPKKGRGSKSQKKQREAAASSAPIEAPTQEQVEEGEAPALPEPMREAQSGPDSVPAPEPVEAQVAPVDAAVASPAPSSNAEQNPAWEYVGDNVVFHPSRFEGLSEQYRRGTCILLVKLLSTLGWPGATQALAALGVQVSVSEEGSPLSR